MKAAWYEKQGPVSKVMVVGVTDDPQPKSGEVRIKVTASGINPGDVKKRQDTFGVGMAYKRVIPHSDGAGTIDAVGEGIAASRIGQRVWCFGAQSYRPFGTAAEYVTVPSEQAIPLSASVSYEQGACLGIPGITAHRAVHVAGPVRDRVVLVQGGAGAVGLCAVALARHAGAHVIASVRSLRDIIVAGKAGAHDVVCTDGLSKDEIIEKIRSYAHDGVHHVVEVSFHANIAIDEQILTLGGSIATYATGGAIPSIPFWPLVFKNIRIFFLGSDDFPDEAKLEAAAGLNAALAGEWKGFETIKQFSLDDIAEAHKYVEDPSQNKRVVLKI